jgi:YHS domain-containing protein
MKNYVSSLLVLTLMSVTSGAFAQQVFTTDGTAIRGYDPVAYFTDQKPVKGDPQFAFKHEGVTWLFASQQHLDVFKADPAKYSPQYGGYCAYGTSEGHKAPTQPDAWTVVNDKLYLNYNQGVKTEWSKNRSERIEKANQQWAVIKDSKP